MGFKNLKTAPKILIGFTITVVVAVIIGVIAIVGFTQINNSSQYSYDNHTTALPQITVVVNQYGRQRAFIRNIIIHYKDNNRVKEEWANIEEADQKIVEAMEELSTKLVTEDAKKSLTELTAQMDNYTKAMDTVYQMALEAEDQEDLDKVTEEMDTNLTNAAEIASNALDDMRASKIKAAEDANIASKKLANQLMMIMIVIIIVGIVISYGFGFFVSSAISKPIKAIQDIANQVADGDLTKHLDKKFFGVKGRSWATCKCY